VILRTLSEGLSAPVTTGVAGSHCAPAAGGLLPLPGPVGRPANDGLWRLPALIYLGAPFAQCLRWHSIRMPF